MNKQGINKHGPRFYDSLETDMYTNSASLAPEGSQIDSQSKAWAKCNQL